MKISEIEGLDNEKAAADTLSKNAKNMQQQAKQAKARMKVKSAQQQLVKATQPINQI